MEVAKHYCILNIASGGLPPLFLGLAVDLQSFEVGEGCLAGLAATCSLKLSSHRTDSGPANNRIEVDSCKVKRGPSM